MIEQFTLSNLSTDRYNDEFHKAFIHRDGRVVYRMSTNNYDDKVAQSLGDQVVPSADGKGASVKVNRSKTLEELDSHSAVMRASNGSRFSNYGVINFQPGNSDRAAIKHLRCACD